MAQLRKYNDPSIGSDPHDLALNNLQIVFPQSGLSNDPSDSTDLEYLQDSDSADSDRFDSSDVDGYALTPDSTSDDADTDADCGSSGGSPDPCLTTYTASNFTEGGNPMCDTGYWDPNWQTS